MELTREQLIDNLMKLQKLGLWHYKRQKETPQIHFLSERKDVKQVKIDYKKLEFLLEREVKRFDFIRTYIDLDTECRSVNLQKYFGEEGADRCGQCDICLAQRKKSEWDDEDIQDVIFSALADSPLLMNELISNAGLPQKEAIELIDSIEEHKRSLYAGCIGVLGDRTDLFVNLRCAQLIENEYFLYLGGGFTKDSIAKKEWQETENKSRTLLDILENS